MKILSIDGVAPGTDTVISNRYKFWSHEHMYTKPGANAVALAFVNYVLSSDFQASSELVAAGFIPTSKVHTQSAADQG